MTKSKLVTHQLARDMIFLMAGVLYIARGWFKFSLPDFRGRSKSLGMLIRVVAHFLHPSDKGGGSQNIMVKICPIFRTPAIIWVMSLKYRTK